MPLEHVFHNENITISLDKSNGYLLNTWTGFPKSEQYKESLENTLEMLQVHGIANIVADLNDLKTPRQADQKWFQTDWIPRAINSGLKKMAILIPKDVIAQMAVKHSIDSVSGLQTSYFESLDTCLLWFKE